VAFLAFPQEHLRFFKVSRNGKGSKEFRYEVVDFYPCILQAFSVFFVCISLTSDMICFLFIPVPWLFFAASTYVWVQYVWHTGKERDPSV